MASRLSFRFRSSHSGLDNAQAIKVCTLILAYSLKIRAVFLENSISVPSTALGRFGDAFRSWKGAKRGARLRPRDGARRFAVAPAAGCLSPGWGVLRGCGSDTPAGWGETLRCCPCCWLRLAWLGAWVAAAWDLRVTTGRPETCAPALATSYASSSPSNLR